MEKKSVYDFTVNDPNGNKVDLKKYQGNVSIIVNVASKCGYTEDNYKGLQSLHDKFKNRGFEVLAFPSNSFFQESGSNSEICEFAKNKFKVTFPIFGKVEVNGYSEDPLYTFIKEKAPAVLLGLKVKW
jgi:glutathione peroxidase